MRLREEAQSAGQDLPFSEDSDSEAEAGPSWAPRRGAAALRDREDGDDVDGDECTDDLGLDGAGGGPHAAVLAMGSDEEGSDNGDMINHAEERPASKRKMPEDGNEALAKRLALARSDPDQAGGAGLGDAGRAREPPPYTPVVQAVTAISTRVPEQTSTGACAPSTPAVGRSQTLTSPAVLAASAERVRFAEQAAIAEQRRKVAVVAAECAAQARAAADSEAAEASAAFESATKAKLLAEQEALAAAAVVQARAAGGGGR